MALKVFVDFDGTVTRHDVGNAFFRTFGGRECELAVQEYREERITAQDCFRREVAAISPVDEEQVRKFLSAQPIDPTFGKFVEYCRARGIDLYIVSDGLDYYIDLILTEHGIHGVSRFANHLERSTPDSAGRLPLSISFPHADAVCTRCACCKRNIMLTHAGDDDLIVFMGEGYSDRCPVRYADVVFAKDELQRYCQQENISYFLYENFNDVLQRIEAISARKRFRKPRRAELLRREAFMTE